MPYGLLFQVLVRAVVVTADFTRCAGRGRQVLVLAIVRPNDEGTVLISHVQTDILAVVVTHELSVLGILRPPSWPRMPRRTSRSGKAIRWLYACRCRYTVRQ